MPDIHIGPGYAMRTQSYIGFQKPILPSWLQLPSANLDFSPAELRKRQFLEALLFPGTIVLLGFGLAHAIGGHRLEATFDMATWLFLIASLILLRRVRNAAWIFRINALVVGGLLLGEAVHHGGDVSRLFALMIYPILTCFMLGRLEGLTWGLGGGLMLSLFFWDLVPGGQAYAYSGGVKLRFLTVYFVLTAMGFVYESARMAYENLQNKKQGELEAEKVKLQAAKKVLLETNPQLKNSRRRLAKAQALARIGSWEYDLEKGRLWGSAEALKIFGLDQTEKSLPLEDMTEITPHSHHLRDALEDLVHYGKPFDLELPLNRDPEAGEAMLHFKAERIHDTNKSTLKVFGIVQDITARKKAENERTRLEHQLQQAQKMEVLGTLAGGVAHDLNNILAGVLNYPELLLLDLAADHPMRKSIETIKSSGEKAAAIVQDLLTMARRNVATHDVMNLNTVIREYLVSPEFERLQAFHPGVQIETCLESPLLNMLGSPVHLSKTVMNLVSNAAEAMPQGGVVTISSANRPNVRGVSSDHATPPAGYVQLEVHDQGMGISEEDRQRIFEPFFTKKVMGRSGTGLGMAVVWGTVQDHRGLIEIESSPGKGSTFSLLFPATRAKQLETTTVKVRGALPRGNGERILVVDDLADQRLIAAALLRKLGYEVALVDSGEAALKFVIQQRADLILLDMMMEPGLSGLETYRRVIAIKPGQPTLLASGYPKNGQVTRALSLGANDYLKKPYKLTELAVAVKAALSPKILT